MDNKSIANILYETADLLEIDGQDSFRIRSYRNAAQAIENLTEQIKDIIGEPKKVLAIPGIGKGMLINLQELFKDGSLSVQADLLKKYHPSMLQLLKIQGLGPKTIALIWSAHKVCDVDGVEKLAREGKIRELPRMGEKHEQKLLKAIEDYRRISGRFLIDAAEAEADKLTGYLAKFPGIERITPAGSLRRGRETVGDLDILVTGTACCDDQQRAGAIEYVAKYPPLMDVIAKGDNKISFRLRSDMQVDVRLLPPESFGAAMQYFTGSKAHNVALRQRALKMGYTLNEYSLRGDFRSHERGRPARQRRPQRFRCRAATPSRQRSPARRSDQHGPSIAGDGGCTLVRARAVGGAGVPFCTVSSAPTTTTVGARRRDGPTCPSRIAIHDRRKRGGRRGRDALVCHPPDRRVRRLFESGARARCREAERCRTS